MAPWTPSRVAPVPTFTENAGPAMTKPRSVSLSDWLKRMNSGNSR